MPHRAKFDNVVAVYCKLSKEQKQLCSCMHLDLDNDI